MEKFGVFFKLWYYTTIPAECKAQFCRGGGDPAVMDWGFVFQLIGVCAAASGFMRLLEWIEGRR